MSVEAALGALAESDPFAITEAGSEIQRTIERFLYRQAEFLDEKRWDDWLALFTEDGRYWMPAEENQTAGDGVPNIFWEDQELMRIRIRRNQHPRAHSQAPNNRLSHVVSGVLIERVENNGDLIVRSRFTCAEYLRYEVRHFSGKYRHYLANTTEGYRIAVQRVDLVNREGPYDYVMQWWL